LGQDVRSVAAVIEGLMPMLRYSAKALERSQFGPQLFREQELPGERTGPEIRAKPQSSSLGAMARIVQWLLQEWRSRFKKKESRTLRISEGYRYQQLIDLQEHPNGIPTWFARLIASLLPSNDLWILLDPDPALQSGGQEQPADAVRQLNSYRSFVKTRRRHAILDASHPTNCVSECAYAAIIGTLTERADRTLKSRF
jgi:hypothetical protein